MLQEAWKGQRLCFISMSFLGRNCSVELLVYLLLKGIVFWSDAISLDFGSSSVKGAVFNSFLSPNLENNGRIINLKAVQINIPVSNFILNNKSNNKNTPLGTDSNEIWGKDLINRLSSKIVKNKLFLLIYFTLRFFGGFCGFFFNLTQTAWTCQKALTEFSLRPAINICFHTQGILSFLACFYWSNTQGWQGYLSLLSTQANKHI